MGVLLDSSRRPPLQLLGGVNWPLALTAIALLHVVDPSATAKAQSLASPFATVSQRVDSTTITVEYYRPSVCGRTLFGKLIRWEQRGHQEQTGRRRSRWIAMFRSRGNCCRVASTRFG